MEDSVKLYVRHHKVSGYFPASIVYTALPDTTQHWPRVVEHVVVSVRPLPSMSISIMKIVSVVMMVDENSIWNMIALADSVASQVCPE